MKYLIILTLISFASLTFGNHEPSPNGRGKPHVDTSNYQMVRQQCWEYKKLINFVRTNSTGPATINLSIDWLKHIASQYSTDMDTMVDLCAIVGEDPKL